MSHNHHLISKFSGEEEELNNKIVFGLDEAGRGPLIGRVYAGCVWWNPEISSTIIKDSKKYATREDREKAYEYIIQNSLCWGVGYVEPWEIDSINIRNAVFKAMKNAIEDSKICPQHLLVDGDSFVYYGDHFGNLPSYTTVIEGDNKYTCIAAASVIAKVEHDRYIRKLCEDNPELKLDEKYGLLSNFGYATEKHREGIRNHGITKWHRKSFKSCK